MLAYAFGIGSSICCCCYNSYICIVVVTKCHLLSTSLMIHFQGWSLMLDSMSHSESSLSSAWQSTDSPAKAPQYLTTFVSEIATRQHSWSTSRHQLVISSHCMASNFHTSRFYCWAALNLLLDYLRDHGFSSASFRSSLKTFLFSSYHAYSGLVATAMMCSINAQINVTI